MKCGNEGEGRSSFLTLSLKNHCVGKIHSKFKRGLNIQFNDVLVHVGLAGSSLSAIGLNIEELKLRRILEASSIGDIVINKDNKLIFYSTFEIISLNYKDIEEVDLRLSKLEIDPKNIPDTVLYKRLESTDFHKFIGMELDELTLKYTALLLNSNKHDLCTNSQIAAFFTGRGKGLTPSGDDILMGFTLALMTSGKFPNWEKALRQVMTARRTTDISAAYARALLEGYTSEYFILLVKLLKEDDQEAIEDTIKKIQAFGHTSGNDTLFGFYLGLTFLINKLEQQLTAVDVLQ
jgi:hypothetical protein